MPWRPIGKGVKLASKNGTLNAAAKGAQIRQNSPLLPVEWFAANVTQEFCSSTAKTPSGLVKIATLRLLIAKFGSPFWTLWKGLNWIALDGKAPSPSLSNICGQPAKCFIQTMSGSWIWNTDSFLPMAKSSR